MRTVSVALAAHLAAETTTLATLWKVTRADATVFGFTDHDADITLNSVTYAAATGFARSAVRATLGLETDNLELTGALASSAITVEDVRAGLWDYATVETFVVNWADLTQGALQQSRGKLGEIRDGRNSFVTELLGLSTLLSQPVGRIYLPSCDADLGDSRCTKSLVAFTVTGTVTGVTSKRAFADSGRTEADGYFNAGKLTWTGGDNSGFVMEVKGYLNSGGAFQLQLPMPYTIQAGDPYTLIAGCDKTLATCKDVFNNVVNFRGFPSIPGPRQVASGGL
jgi:uncharacterized phage protein (TIGR02218 family)